MDKIDQKLMNLYIDHYNEDNKIKLRDDIIVTIFTKESITNAISDCEIVYNENYEANRKRKMRLAKMINEKILKYEINEHTLKSFDDIRYVLVNNSLFENMCDFCNLEIDEEMLSGSFDNFASTNDMDYIRNQCYKDLLVLRILWFSNKVHRLLTELPLPKDSYKRKEVLQNIILLRGFINERTKTYVELFLNHIDGQFIRTVETTNLKIKNERQHLTEFGDKTLKNIENLLIRNGYDRDNNTCLNNLEQAKDEVIGFFEIMQSILEKTVKMQQEAYEKEEAEANMNA